MTVERSDPPLAAPERQMLDVWLDFQWDTLALKCGGPTGDQLRARVCPSPRRPKVGQVPLTLWSDMVVRLLRTWPIADRSRFAG